MAFGNKVASDTRDTSGGEWIRYFKDDETQLRILPAEAVNKRGETVYGTAAWPQEYEHFDRSIKIGFPCPDTDDCIGCNSPDKEVRKKGRKIYMFALDEEGEPRIYRIGPQLYKRLKMKEQRQLARKPKNLQPLSDRDFIILKSGKGMDTEYDAEAGEEAYDIDFPDAEDLPDLAESLQTAYEDAVAEYGGYVDDEDDDDEEEEAPKPRKRAAKKPAPEPEDDEDDEEEEEAPKPRKRTARKAKPATEPEEDEDDEEEEEEEAPKAKPRKRAAKKADAPETALPTEPSDEELESATTEELREWLTSKGTEFPPRAPRARLVKIAKEDAPRY